MKRIITILFTIAAIVILLFVTCGMPARESPADDGNESSITLDGIISEDDWGDAKIVDTPSGDEANTGDKIDKIYIVNDNNYLYIGVLLEEEEGANYSSCMILIDTDSNNATGIKNLEGGTTFWMGTQGSKTDSYGWDYLVRPDNGATTYYAYTFANDASAGIDVSADVPLGIDIDTHNYEFKISLADAGLSSGSKIPIVAVSQNCYGGPPTDVWELYDFAPDQTVAASGAGSGSITIDTTYEYTID